MESVLPDVFMVVDGDMTADETMVDEAETGVETNKSVEVGEDMAGDMAEEEDMVEVVSQSSMVEVVSQTGDMAEEIIEVVEGDKTVEGIMVKEVVGVGMKEEEEETEEEDMAEVASQTGDMAEETIEVEGAMSGEDMVNETVGIEEEETEEDIDKDPPPESSGSLVLDQRRMQVRCVRPMNLLFC